MDTSPTTVSGAADSALIDFPGDEPNDPNRLFAEYAILGGMLQASEPFIRSGANADWTHPMSEAIARACVEAWEQHGADSDEAWRCHCSAYLARYTGRSPLVDPAMRAWVCYMIGFWRLQFTQVLADEELADLDSLHDWLQSEKALVEEEARKAKLQSIHAHHCPSHPHHSPSLAHSAAPQT